MPASACPKKHAPTNTLRLAFTPSAATAALPRLTYAWACTQPASGCPNLAAPGVTSGGINKPNLVRQVQNRDLKRCGIKEYVVQHAAMNGRPSQEQPNNLQTQTDRFVGKLCSACGQACRRVFYTGRPGQGTLQLASVAPTAANI